MRSTEVARVFVFLGRPDGFGSSDFAQFVNCFMLYRSILASGADSRKNKEFGVVDRGRVEFRGLLPRG